MILTHSRSLMLLAKKANFGSPRTKTTPPTRSAGYGTSTLSSWHRNRSAPNGILHLFYQHTPTLYSFILSPPDEVTSLILQDINYVPGVHAAIPSLKIRKSRFMASTVISSQSISVSSKAYSKDFSFFFLIIRVFATANSISSSKTSRTTKLFEAGSITHQQRWLDGNMDGVSCRYKYTRLMRRTCSGVLRIVQRFCFVFNFLWLFWPEGGQSRPSV